MNDYLLNKELDRYDTAEQEYADIASSLQLRLDELRDIAYDAGKESMMEELTNAEYQVFEREFHISLEIS